MAKDKNIPMCPKDLQTAHEFIKHFHADNVHLRARMEQKWQEALDLEQSNRELQNRLTKITQERDQARRDMQSWYQETLRLRAFSGRGGPSNGQG